MKDDLRKKYLDIRKNISNKSIKDNIIFSKVISNKHLATKELVLIYVSLPFEVDTIKLIKYFLKCKKVAVPKIENGIMNFYYIQSLDDLQKGKFNILEPKTKIKVENFSNAVCITPGICFDKNNYRIGYGKGFYDKFFSSYNIYSIGLCYQECFIDNVYSLSWDYPVNEVITD